MTKGKIIAVAILVPLAIVALSVGVWLAAVALSGPKGVGDAVIQKNSAANWTQAQADFEKRYAEYNATLTRIDTFYAVHQSSPNDAVAQTNWLGQISHCTDVVADYNAAARSFLSEDFRSADLPDQLDNRHCTTTQENK